MDDNNMMSRVRTQIAISACLLFASLTVPMDPADASRFSCRPIGDEHPHGAYSHELTSTNAMDSGTWVWERWDKKTHGPYQSYTLSYYGATYCN